MRPSGPPMLAAGELDLSQLSDAEIGAAKRTVSKLMEWAWHNSPAAKPVGLGTVMAFWFLLGSEQRRRKALAGGHQSVHPIGPTYE